MAPWPNHPVASLPEPTMFVTSNPQPAARGMKSSVPDRRHPSSHPSSHPSWAMALHPELPIRCRRQTRPGLPSACPRSACPRPRAARCTSQREGSRSGVSASRWCHASNGTPATVRASGELQLSGWENPGEWVRHAACGMRACTQPRLPGPALTQGEEGKWSRRL